MYDTSLTLQTLPNERYIYLLGVSISVFASNNGFIIENILRTNPEKSWYDLIDKTSGGLMHDINETITQKADPDIASLFEALVDKRNRIMHGFRVTSKEGEQILATKDKQNVQYEIDEKYLEEFIKLNNMLSKMLHEYRGY